MMQTERVIKQAILDQIPFVVVINKMDRLILELKLPPTDAYYKIRHTLEDINALITLYAPNSSFRQAFASFFSFLCSLEWDLNMEMYVLHQEVMDGHLHFLLLQRFIQICMVCNLLFFSRNIPGNFNSEEFAKRLWGDIFFNTVDRKFYKKAPTPDVPRYIVFFVILIQQKNICTFCIGASV